MKKILISTIVSAQLILAQSVNITYNYDNISRLKSVSYTTGQSVNYTYDKAGNITNVAVNGKVVDCNDGNALTIDTYNSGTGQCEHALDSDGDGVPNALDAFPNDPTETVDSDHDGHGDNSDAFPNNPNEWADINNNGIGDNSENLTTRDLSLDTGWHLIALPMIQAKAISSVVTPEITVIRSYQNEKWYTWTKTNAQTTDEPLINLEKGYGYWIKASAPTTISVTGTEVSGTSTTIATDGKWHMAGSTQIHDMPTFFTNHPTVTTVWKYSNGEWLSVSRDATIQNTMTDANITQLNSINIGEGFMYK